MRFQCSTLVLLCAALVATWVDGARAQSDYFSPARTRHYQFVPRASVLNEQGGIAGFNRNYFIKGTYDFITTLSPLAVYPPIILGDFDNVAATAWPAFPTPAVMPGLQIKLDAAINLSGLQGSSQFNGPTNVFRFRGKTENGSSVELWAATRGPWMYMRGETTPPPKTADYFRYHVKALAHERPFADLNDDGVVDAADLSSWIAPTARDNLNFLAWQAQLGETAPEEAEFEAAITAASVSLGSGVPEPGSAALLLAGAAALAAARRRRR